MRTPPPLIPSANAQRGVALVVSLILLLVITLMSLGGMQNATLQERMSGNMYDRSLAMQAAESALIAAQDALTADPANFTVDCIDANPACPAVPADAFTGNGAGWTNVGAGYAVNAGVSAGTPQYQIQRIFAGPVEADNDQGSGLSDIAGNYGMGGGSAGPVTATIYRVTARSQAPVANDPRAIVVLQSTVRRDD